tara:strand:- start:10843 stop:11181 length:339 start_codon:yes stop_codon:yes gene_type:complete
MKTYLVFKQNGEIEEKTIDKKSFNIAFFEDFKYYKEYNNLIILFNKHKKRLNLTIFPFTDDRYTGDVCLLQTNEDKRHLKNLSINIYAKKLNSIKCEKNEMYYSSDEELFSF